MAPQRDVRLQPGHARLQPLLWGARLQAASCRLQAAGCRLQAARGAARTMCERDECVFSPLSACTRRDAASSTRRAAPAASLTAW